ncbi:MAG: hypothetical protein IJL37_06750 [Bacteroidaceae bacterium]|nr:hypothetical protein [Bacteroidaceae bacterium]
MMKKTKFIKIAACIAVVLLILYAQSGHINLPGHGNRENRNFEEAVISHVSASIVDGEKVEFGSKYLCEDYKENGEVRFSANVSYYIVSTDGTKEKHTAHVVCNEDKDRIIEWKDINND